MAIDLPKRVAENIDRFTGRAWLLPQLLEWWDESDERLFLLTGGPGTGKSMIIAWLAGFGPGPTDPSAREQIARLRKAFKAAHFCQAATRNIAPKAFADAIANQLTNTVHGFSDALAATLAERVQIVGTAHADSAAPGANLTGNAIGRIDLGGLGDELSFDRAFTEPLKKLYASGHSEPMLLLVDALDEALGYSGDKTLPELLSTLGDLPSKVRILVTTRDDPRVLDFYDDVKPVDLIKKAPPDVDDVQDYVFRRMSDSAGLASVQRVEFSRRVAAQAKGVFLYAAIVLDELVPRLPHIPNLETYPLPNGLSGLYRAFLKRELGTEDKGRRWKRTYKPLLGLIAVAQGEGLTATQLAALVGQDVEEPLDVCKQYLIGVLPGGPFQPFHKSFADFLLEDTNNVRYHIDAQEMHQRIAEHYWAKHHEDWSKCDDYGLQSLATHFYEAQQSESLAALISQEWMNAKVERHGYRYEGFVSDLMLAWKRAHTQALGDIDADREPHALSESLRFALIRASITSRVSEYEPALVKRAVEAGRWSLARALSVAAQVRAPRHQARLFDAALAAHCPDGNDQERRRAASNALPTARAIADPESRSIALSALAALLSRAEKDVAWSESLAAAREIQDVAPRIRALAALAPRLSGPEQDSALRTAVLALAPSGAATMRSTSPPGLGQRSLLEALAALAPLLAGSLLEEAGSLARRRFVDNDDRARALAALAPQLNGVEKEAALREALAAVCTIEDEGACTSALAALAKQLTGALLAEALSIARDRIKGDTALASALASLAPQNNEPEKAELLRDALSRARLISDERDRSTVLAVLGPHLSGSLLDGALLAAGEIRDKGSRAKVLTALAQRLTGGEQEACLSRALAAASDTDHDWREARLLAALAPLLSGPVVDEALKAAREIKEGVPRAYALATLAPKLAGAEQEAVLRDAVRAVGRSARAGGSEALAELAPRLAGPLLDEALSAQGIEDQAFCATALAALARSINVPRKETVLRNALAAATAIENGWERGEQLAALAPQLDEPLVAEALSVARAIEGKAAQGKAKALTALAARLGTAEKEAIVLEALSTVMSIDQQAPRAALLAALSPQLSGPAKQSVLRDALAAARGIRGIIGSQGDELRSKVLVTLAPELGGPLLAQALSDVRHMGFGRARAEALAALAQQLTATQKETILGDELSALSEAQKTRSSSQLANALAGLAPVLCGSSLAQAMLLARSIPEGAPEAKLTALTRLLSQLSGAEKGAALAEARSSAYRVERPESRAVAFAALAPHLTGQEKDLALNEALEAARKCAGDEPRASALATLAAQLGGQFLVDALSQAKAIEDDQCRARAVQAIAKKARDCGELLGDLRRYVVDRLWSVLSQGERREVYEFCASEDLMRPPIVNARVVEEAAMHIAEIGLHWSWP